ncbi:GH92 family glycosyl hydrolase [Ornithobacterium rhinotracheale]|uniref:GH92 family glycosyl hydrolase n=1 Tax=Ornithobacterium rhinotracheale TaxID=28251 RepID=UPI003873995D
MKKILFALAFVCFYAQIQAQVNEYPTSPVDYVNPLMGTDSKFALSNGNTYPAIGRPWGMNLWTPQTNKNGDGWVYQYSADKINGFKQTHQPSPWMNDYGAFAIMPIVGKLRFEEGDRASWYSHKTEETTPYDYKVYLADEDITAELAPTERAAILQFTYPKTDSAMIVVDAYHKGSWVKYLPKENKIVGYNTFNNGGVADNFKNYFVIELSQKPDFYKTWNNGKFENSPEVKSERAGIVVGFNKTKKGEKITCRVASSFISLEQAEQNLKAELGSKSLAQVKEEGKKEWNEVLSKVLVKGGDENQMRTFYSCLYRMVFFPLRMYEITQNGDIVHYSPQNGKVEKGYKFAGTGFWDTFRALYPFLNLMYPSINKQMQEGLINDYKEGGWLPEWSSPGYRGIMIGNNSASVVAEAYIKGLRGYDIETLYEALIHGANNEGPGATGRKGVAYYNQLGYVPNDVDINENVARSLEYAYDDFAIYQLAKALKKPKKEIEKYRKKAFNYKKLFKPENKLMAPKNKDGKFSPNFNPFSWGGAFTEGNSWHYSWSVFQDIEGLKNLMGGNREFVQMLDSIFVIPPTYEASYYGGIIHEIREMQVMGMGQYAHGNQPIQHMIYLYDYAGEPWKTQKWAREVMNRMYNANPDGYCGDEDNGQTSAWYVFSALGMYPVTPAYPEYALGAPLFKEATLSFENGKKLKIEAPNNSAQNRYADKVWVNGKLYDKNYFNHFDLLKGGVIKFDMQAEPNKKRGTSKNAYPFSMSLER